MLSCPGCISMVTAGWDMLTPTQNTKTVSQKHSRVRSSWHRRSLPAKSFIFPTQLWGERNVSDMSRYLTATLPCARDTVWVAPEGPKEAAAASSESSGVGSGGGNWMLVRSGRDPPVLWLAGLSGGVSCWSGDGNMLQRVAWAVSQQQQTWNQAAEKTGVRAWWQM